MKEWILKNTIITEEQYDSLINANTINMIEESITENDKKNEELTNEKTETLRKVFDHPLCTIDAFTLEKPTLLRKITYGVKGKNNEYTCKNIKFSILAEQLKDKQDILYSEDRKGICGDLSSYICAITPNTSIVTAMCIDPAYNDQHQFLHSFVIIKREDKKEYVLDSTFNIIIEKEEYLKLLEAKVISNISRKKYYNDLSCLEKLNLGNSISLAEYLCFPDQVIDGVKKLTRTR